MDREGGGGRISGGVARIKSFRGDGMGIGRQEGTTCVVRGDDDMGMSYAPAMCARELAAICRVRKTESRGTL
jgi:hypothetical protein